jgi:hypothetical protein
MTKERLDEFLEEFVFDRYKNNLIILDNVDRHKQLCKRCHYGKQK